MSLLNSTVGMVYSLKADTDDAEKSIKKFSNTVDAETNKIESAGKNAFNSLAKSIGFTESQTAALGTALPVVGAAIAAIASAAAGASVALFAMAKNASDMGSEIYDAQQKTGLAASTLTAMKVAADQSGTSFEAVSGSVNKFAKLMGDAAKGSVEAKEKLKALGVTSNDLETALGQAYKTINKLPEGFQQMTASADAFGKTGPELLSYIKSFDGDLQDLIATAKAAGLTLSEEDIRAADAFGDSLDKLSAVAQTTAAKFALQFAPVITGAMDDVSKSLADNQAKFVRYGSIVGDVLRGIRSAAESELAKTLYWLAESTFKLTVFYQVEAAILDKLREKGAEIRSTEPDNSGGSLEGTGKGKVSTPNVYTDKFPGSSGGKTGDGKQVNVLLPRSGDGYQSYRASSKQYGTEETIENAKLLASTFKDLTGKVLGYGELSIKGGGKYPGHKGHQSGETIDIRPVTKSGSGGPTNFRSADYDQAATRALIELIKKIAPSSKIIFNDPAFVREGLTRKGDSNHDNHLDVSNFGGKGNEVNLVKLAEEQAQKAKAANEERVKLNDEASERVLERAKQTAEEELAINKDKLAKQKISQDEFDKLSEQSDIELLQKEKILLEDRLSYAKQYGVDTIQIEQEIDAVTSQIAVKQTEAETAKYLRSKKYAEDLKALRLEVLRSEQEVIDVQKEGEREQLERNVQNAIGAKARLEALVVLREFELAENIRRQNQDIAEATRQRDMALLDIKDKEKEKEKVEEINKLYQNRLNIINQIREKQDGDTNRNLNPPIEKTTGEANGGIFAAIAGIFSDAGGGKDVTEGIKTEADKIKAVHEDIANSQNRAISSMVAGLGQLVAQWAITGKFSAKAALGMVAGIAAGLAIEAGLKALMQYAEGLAMAANPITAFLAPGHFAAAAAYGAAALAAGGVAVGTGLAARAFGNKQGTAAADRQLGTGANNPATGGITTRQANGPGAYSSYGDDEKVYDQTGVNPTEIHRFEIMVGNDKFVVDAIKRNADGNGDLRDLIRKLSGD